MAFNRKVVCAAVVAITCTISAGPTFAYDTIEQAIKARKSLMTLYSINLGQLAAMARGQQDYDAAKAKTAAENIKTLASMNNGVVWPQGSDSTAFPGKSRAKIEAWTTYPASAELQKALIESAAKLAAVAGNGLDSVSSNLGGIGGACKACHEKYREPK